MPRPRQRVNFVALDRIVIAEVRSQGRETPIDALRAEAAVRVHCGALAHLAATTGVGDQAFGNEVINQLHDLCLGVPEEGVVDSEAAVKKSRDEGRESGKDLRMGGASNACDSLDDAMTKLDDVMLSLDEDHVDRRILQSFKQDLQRVMAMPKPNRFYLTPPGAVRLL